MTSNMATNWVACLLFSFGIIACLPEIPSSAKASSYFSKVPVTIGDGTEHVVGRNSENPSTLLTTMRKLKTKNLHCSYQDRFHTQTNFEKPGTSASEMAEKPLQDNSITPMRLKSSPAAQAPAQVSRILEMQPERKSTAAQLTAAPLATTPLLNLSEVQRRAIDVASSSFRKPPPTSVARGYMEAVAGMRQSILARIGQIVADLQDLERVFSNNNPYRSVNQNILKRLVRSPLPPTKPRPECRITQDQLKDLDRSINQTILGLSSMSVGSISCSRNASNSNNCVKWITNIKCGIHHLQSGFEQAATDKISVAEIIAWKNAYEKLLAQYNKTVDEVRASVSEEYSAKVVKLESDMQDLQNEIIEKLQPALSAAILKTRQTKTKLCITYIQLEEYRNAVDEFKELDDNTLLDGIVTQAYNGTLDNVPKVIAFVRMLPSCDQDAIAYPILYAKMRNNSHSTSPHILTLANRMECASRSEIMNLKLKLERSKNSLVESWGNKIRDKGYDQIQAYAKRFDVDFVVHLELIIQKAFSNKMTNSPNVIAFIDALPYPRDQVLGYPSLFEAMQKNSDGFNGREIVLLAYRCKTLMESNMGQASSSEMQRLMDVKGKLPKGIKALLWDSFIYITSRKHAGYYLNLVREIVDPGLFHSFYYKLSACRSRSHGHTNWLVNQRGMGRYFVFENREYGTAFLENKDEWEVIFVSNGEFAYFKRRQDSKIMCVEDFSGWSKFWSGISSECDGVETVVSYSQDLCLWSIS